MRSCGGYGCYSVDSTDHGRGGDAGVGGTGDGETGAGETGLAVSARFNAFSRKCAIPIPPLWLMSRARFSRANSIIEPLVPFSSSLSSPSFTDFSICPINRDSNSWATVWTVSYTHLDVYKRQW